MVSGPSGPQFNQANMLRLLKAKEAKKLAEEAQVMANEQKQQITAPSADIVERARQATQAGTEPTPLDNPNFFARLGTNTLDAISAPGEVGAGLAFDLFSKDFSKRRRQLQDETPEKGLFDYFGSVRKAYKEKDLPLKYSLPLEIALDPLTYIPVAGAVNVGRRLLKGGAEVAKVAKVPKLQSTMDFDQVIKVSDDQIERTAKTGTNDEVYKGGIISKTLETLKGRGFKLNLKNNVDRALFKHINIGSKINSMASANAAKVNSVKIWNKDFINKDGIIANTGIDGVDGKQMYEALEDVFDVEKFTKKRDVVDYDDIAKQIDGNENQTWLNLIASKEGLDKIKDALVDNKIFSNGTYKGKINDDHVRSLGQYLYGFTDLAKQALAKGVDLKLITGTAYVSRRVLSRNVDTIINQKSTKLGQEGASQKVRKIRREDYTPNEYTEQLLAIAKGDQTKYLTDLSEVYAAYSRDLYSSMNDNVLRRRLDTLAMDPNSGIGFDVGAKLPELNKLIQKIADNKFVITNKDINKLKSLGFQNLVEAAGDSKNFKRLIQAKKALEAKDIEKGVSAYAFRMKHGRELPANFKNFFFTGANAEQLAKRARDLTGFRDDNLFTEMAGKFEVVGNALRTLKTGFDFGFALLQGLPTLARGFLGDVNAFKTWGASVKNGAKVMFSPQAVDQFMSEMRDVIVKTVDGDDISLLDEYVAMGGELGEYATDIYRGGSSITRGLGRFGKAGNVAGKAFQATLTPFERSFQFSSDTLRLKGYQYMRNTLFKNAPDGEKAEALKQYVQFLNKSTGALNPAASGIPLSQQAIERAFIFFSPRYTRASFSLIADVLRGGIQGAEARKTLAGMAGFGILHYTAIASALNQEVHLDPRNSKFLTVEINGNRVGIGSFWTSFARFVTKSVDYFDPFDGEKTIREEQENNPIFNYFKGMTASVSGLIYELATGADFLGRDIEFGTDWAKHIATSALPLTLESTILEGGDFGSRATRFVSGFFGTRERPLSVWEQRNNMRDDLSAEKYGKKYEDLNGFQRKQLDLDSPQLEALNAEARALSAEMGDDFDAKVTNYYTERNAIQQDYENNLAIKELQGYYQGFRPSDFRDLVLKPENRKKQTKYEILQKKLEPGAEFEQVQRYFDEMGKTFSDKAQIEDIAYQDYIETVINGDWDNVRGYNWQDREQAERDFRIKWGSEYFDYVQQRLKQGKDLPGLAGEFVEMREEYGYFWKSIEQAVIESRDDPEYAQALRSQWLRGTDAEREALEDIEELKNINKLISDSKVQLRKLDPGLDGFLFRWGYTTSLVHSDNKNLEDFYNRYDRIEKAVYKNGGPVDFAQV